MSDRGALFARVFRNGQKRKDVTIEVRELGRLHVTSGRIVACDPLMFPDGAPFAISVPIGAHPVIGAIVNNGTDERIACVKLKWVETEPDAWQLAHIEGDDPADYGDEGPGYGVDAGLGCFMDAETAEIYNRCLNDTVESADFNYYVDVLKPEFAPNYKHTREWCSHHPIASDPRNVVMFSSGLGEGIYPSYFGLKAGVPVCLVTDFCILDDD